ncbi:hypothetical protein QJQ45_013483 [Haematococcus lacustris]|nr:hypothetical protein QJQ45_013483 [Haematococcus lacustris]
MPASRTGWLEIHVEGKAAAYRSEQNLLAIGQVTAQMSEVIMACDNLKPALIPLAHRTCAEAAAAAHAVGQRLQGQEPASQLQPMPRLSSTPTQAPAQPGPAHAPCPHHLPDQPPSHPSQLQGSSQHHPALPALLHSPGLSILTRPATNPVTSPAVEQQPIIHTTEEQDEQTVPPSMPKQQQDWATARLQLQPDADGSVMLTVRQYGKPSPVVGSRPVELLCMRVSLSDAVGMLNKQMPEYIKHHRLAHHQLQVFREHREAIKAGKDGKVVISCDWSEKLTVERSVEIMSEHWHAAQIGILVACAYFKNKEGAYYEQTVYVMTDGKEQSAAITQAAVNQVVCYLLAEHAMDMRQLYMWSDGCAGQFKGAPAMRQHWERQADTMVQCVSRKVAAHPAVTEGGGLTLKCDDGELPVLRDVFVVSSPLMEELLTTGSKSVKVRTRSERAREMARASSHAHCPVSQHSPGRPYNFSELLQFVSSRLATELPSTWSLDPSAPGYIIKWLVTAEQLQLDALKQAALEGLKKQPGQQIRTQMDTKALDGDLLRLSLELMLEAWRVATQSSEKVVVRMACTEGMACTDGLYGGD